MSTTARNVLIVLALAGAVYAVPGGEDSARFIGALLSTAIIATFAYLGVRLYREHRVTIFGLGEKHRGLLYSGVAGILFAFAAGARLFDSGAGLLAWFAIVGASIYALVTVFRYYKSYSF